jgi:hypothetical protein
MYEVGEEGQSPKSEEIVLFVAKILSGVECGGRRREGWAAEEPHYIDLGGARRHVT